MHWIFLILICAPSEQRHWYDIVILHQWHESWFSFLGWAWCLQIAKAWSHRPQSGLDWHYCCCCLAELFATSPTSLLHAIRPEFARQKLRKQAGPVRRAGRGGRHTHGIQPFFIVDKTWRDLTRTPAAQPGQVGETQKMCKWRISNQDFTFELMKLALDREIFSVELIKIFSCFNYHRP